MTFPETEPHVRAVLDMLRLKLPKSITASLGVAPAAKGAFLALYPDAGAVSAARLCATSSDIRIGIMVHAVGDGPEQCLWVMDKARAALVDSRPIVPGRTVHRITQTLGPQPLTRDQTLQPPKFLTTAEYTIRSQNGS